MPTAGNPSLGPPAEPPSRSEARGRGSGEIPDRHSPPAQSDAVGDRATPTPSGPEEPSPASDEPDLRPRRLAWAELLRRVFALDVLECPRCGGRMSLLAAIQPPEATEAILECLELRSRSPPAAPAVTASEEWSGDFEASL